VSYGMRDMNNTKELKRRTKVTMINNRKALLERVIILGPIVGCLYVFLFLIHGPTGLIAKQTIKSYIFFFGSVLLIVILFLKYINWHYHFEFKKNVNNLDEESKRSKEVNVDCAQCGGPLVEDIDNRKKKLGCLISLVSFCLGVILGFFKPITHGDIDIFMGLSFFAVGYYGATLIQKAHIYRCADCGAITPRKKTKPSGKQLHSERQNETKKQKKTDGNKGKNE